MFTFQLNSLVGLFVGESEVARNHPRTRTKLALEFGQKLVERSGQQIDEHVRRIREICSKEILVPDGNTAAKRFCYEAELGKKAWQGCDLDADSRNIFTVQKCGKQDSAITRTKIIQLCSRRKFERGNNIVEGMAAHRYERRGCEQATIQS